MQKPYIIEAPCADYNVKHRANMTSQSYPMITTIIPTFRRPELLRRAVTSALAQEGVSLQVCVYDNASSDSTGIVVAELAKKDPRVKYFCHQKNIGGMANFQFGLKNANQQHRLR